MKQICLLVLFGNLMVLFACNENYYFQEEVAIPEGNWSYENPVDFSVNIEDTAAIYNLFLEIEHTLEYPRQNIYLQIHTSFPSGEKLKEQLSIDLANKAGVWYGDCSSKSCRLVIPIQEGAYFNQPGEYQFQIEQFTRINPLPGISNISLAIEDTGVKR